MNTSTNATAITPTQGRWQRIKQSDIYWSFTNHIPAMIASLMLLILMLGALLAPWLAPQNPFDPTQLDLLNAEIPPIWMDDGQFPFLLGTDNQGRDVFSSLLYGSRVSFLIGILSVLVSLVIGLALGLVAGYYQGVVDNLLMRLGDVFLSIPTLLMAILVSAVVRQMLPPELRDYAALGVLVLAISLSNWVQYARTVRAQTSVERGKEYVQAARLLKVPAHRIMFKHILPNTLTPILVTATLSFGMAILTEATLSFLGIGMPASQPSLGTLIRLGNEFLFSGLWWITLFPVLQLCVLVVSVNVLGDWLRDALNPKLRH